MKRTMSAMSKAFSAIGLCLAASTAANAGAPESLAKAGFTEVKRLESVPKEIQGPMNSIAWINPAVSGDAIKSATTPSAIGEITEETFRLRNSQESIREVYEAWKVAKSGTNERFIVLVTTESVVFLTRSAFETKNAKAKWVCDVRKRTGNLIWVRLFWNSSLGIRVRHMSELGS